MKKEKRVFSLAELQTKQALKAYGYWLWKIMILEALADEIIKLLILACFC